MHDRVPCHKSLAVTKFLDKENTKTLLCLRNSSGINPIENLWNTIKKKLKICNITNKNSLIERLILIWNYDNEIQINIQNPMQVYQDVSNL